MPDPPKPQAVASAVAELQQLSAMDAREQLTPLGRLLALLPGVPLVSGWRLACLASCLAVGLLARTDCLFCTLIASGPS